MGAVSDAREATKGIQTLANEAQTLLPMARILTLVAIGGITIITTISIMSFFVYLERNTE